MPMDVKPGNSCTQCTKYINCSTKYEGMDGRMDGREKEGRRKGEGRGREQIKIHQGEAPVDQLQGRLMQGRSPLPPQTRRGCSISSM